MITEKLLDLEPSKRCFCSGILIINSENKSTIIDQVQKSLWVVEPEGYCNNEPYLKDDKFQVLLEDESGRIALNVDIIKEKLVTGLEFYPGCYISVIGQLNDQKSIFEVEKIIYTKETKEVKFENIQKSVGNLFNIDQKPEYIGFVSGLNIGSDKETKNVELQLLVDYLSGYLKTSKELAPENVLQLVILGNLYGEINQADFVDDPKAIINSKTKDPTELVDSFLEGVSKTIKIIIIPGERDPTNIMLPQQPLSGLMFDKTSKESHIKQSTNPSIIEIKANCKIVKMVMSSGQPVHDMKRYLGTNADAIDMLETSFKCAHLSPTSPDTLFISTFSHSKMINELTNLTSKEFIITHPRGTDLFTRGCYTTCRTVCRSSLFDFKGHFQRLKDGTTNSNFVSKEHLSKFNSFFKEEILLKLIGSGLRAYHIHNAGSMDQYPEAKITILLSFMNCNFILKAHFCELKQPLSEKNSAIVRGLPRSSPNVKDTEWVKYSLIKRLRQELETHIKDNVNEVLLYDESTTGIIEGLSSNIFVLCKEEKGPVLYTPNAKLVLDGTIRRLVFKICKANGIEIEERVPLLKERDRWLGAFVTSTSRLVFPLKNIVLKDGTEVTFKETHEVIRRLKNLIHEELFEMSTKIVDQQSIDLN